MPLKKVFEIPIHFPYLKENIYRASKSPSVKIKSSKALLDVAFTIVYCQLSSNETYLRIQVGIHHTPHIREKYPRVDLNLSSTIKLLSQNLQD
jgi:hypothetical protein